MTKEEYKEYLQSEDWQLIRMARLRADNFTCQKCGSKQNLQVHHLTYERVGCECIKDLTTLCKNCHSEVHGIKEVNKMGIVWKKGKSKSIKSEDSLTAFVSRSKRKNEHSDRIRISLKPLVYKAMVDHFKMKNADRIYMELGVSEEHKNRLYMRMNNAEGYVISVTSDKNFSFPSDLFSEIGVTFDFIEKDRGKDFTVQNDATGWFIPIR